MQDVLIDGLPEQRANSSDQVNEMDFPQHLENIHQLEGTPIQEFYRDKTVLITGGTGFLGKVLMEKLLRSCSGVKKIFLIIRNKKNMGLNQRIEKIFDDSLFAELSEKARAKVYGVEGDCSLPGLGLSPQDRQLLEAEVQVVIHGAATVNFEERLSLAIDINVRGIREMLQLAKGMPHLKAFVHVSTAFAQCPNKEIREEFYPPPPTCKDPIKLNESLPPETLDQLTPQLLGEWPNTYVLTKSMAEHLVGGYSKELPIVVVRPAIVVATNTEPVPGWIDNHYGATGVVAGCGTGVLRTLQCDASVHAQIVPVDMVCNTIIAASWHCATKCNTDANDNTASHDSDLRVFNMVTAPENPLTWRQFMGMSYEHGLDIPPSRTMWYICLTLHTSWIMHRLFVVLFHFLPALLIDVAVMLSGRRSNILKLYKKIDKFSNVIAYFGTRRWDFKNSNTQALWAKLDERDQKIFFFDMSQLNWNDYFYKYTHGVRKYLLKDDPKTIPQARIRLRRFYWAHQAIKMLFAYFGIRLVWSLVTYVSQFMT